VFTYFGSLDENYCGKGTEVDTINDLDSLNNSTAPVSAPATSRANYCTYSKFIHIFSRDIHNFQSIIAIVHGRTSLHYALH
jgi:hypothetical protein